MNEDTINRLIELLMDIIYTYKYRIKYLEQQLEMREMEAIKNDK